MREITLYDYQIEQVDFLLRDEVRLGDPRWKIVVSPTSSGKSAVIKSALALRAQRGDDLRAVVLTPQINLERSLLRPERYVVGDERAAFPAEAWAPMREDRDWSWERFVDVGETSGVAIGTHARGALLSTPEDVDLSAVVLVVDEAHHAGQGNKLYRLLAWAHRRGASIWMFTATPERANRRRLVPDAVEPQQYVLPHVELMRRGWPSKISFRTFALGSTPEVVRGDGELVPSDYEIIVNLLQSDERRTYVGVSPGSSVSLAKGLEAALVQAGFDPKEILITTGNDVVTTEEGAIQRADYVERALEERRQRVAVEGWRAAYRVLIDCRRCGEGMDEPTLSRLVVYGVPTSLPAFIQRIGRLMRRKRGPDGRPSWAGFPEAWCDEVEVVMLVPRFDKDRENTTSVLLLTACYFNAPDVARDYMELWEGFCQRLPPRMLQYAMDFQSQLPEELARQRLLVRGLFGVPAHGEDHTTLAQAVDRLHEHLDLPPETPAKLVEGIERAADEPDREVAAQLLQTLLMDVADENPAVLKAMQQAIAEVADLTVDGGTLVESDGGRTVRPALVQAEAERSAFTNALYAKFMEVAREFAEVVVPAREKLAQGLVDGHRGALTADDIEAIGRRLAQERDAVYDLPVGEVRRVLREYTRDTGRLLGDLVGVDEDLSRYVGFVYRQSDLARSIERRWPEFLDLRKAAVLEAHLDDALAPLAGRLPSAAAVEQALGGGSARLAARLRERRWVKSGPNLLAEAIALRLGWRAPTA